jgi:deoxyribodipyrimidine photolyase-related protein
MASYTTLRLILGDQLNLQHSWLNQVDNSVLYVLMEIEPESTYVTHHIQKIIGIFGAMRQFKAQLATDGHATCYYKITDPTNQQSFAKNLNLLVKEHTIQYFEYQLPDEYRLDQLLQNYGTQLPISSQAVDTEHFYTKREDLTAFFQHRKTTIMEPFYRFMRQKHEVLIEGSKPTGGAWNYDKANRKKLPKTHAVAPPYLLEQDVRVIYKDIQEAKLSFIGNIDPKAFVWPMNRKDALAVLEDFLVRMLPYFGLYQDAMHQEHWSLYHSRLSFSLNIKLITPREVIVAVEQIYKENEQIDIAQAEGFIRQILGWREFMRGIYWREMPDYQNLNNLNAQRALPAYFWTGKTKMNCLQKSIQQSLDYAYAHHIQRLMVTGNFCLLTGINPSEVDEWYLGIYIDAFEWVEITNTRGMSQFADGGIIATKPYCASANYINKMGNYCQGCHYDKKEKVGEKACPFNALYWNFIHQHASLLQSNPRMGMVYRIWEKFSSEEQNVILQQAFKYLNHIEQL